ncbi:MAG: EAL domain-containing protein [Nodosilinea sp. WJT8-NPBG4]|jgi:EAL domain-containing protein (putative c-di-GMP-specific phosphodiesterase class I)|nr:EAL domain-containing protein [Nodosilinea sp. WJT8-NPBG4]
MLFIHSTNLLIEIQLGLMRGDFELYYQPVLSLKEDKVIGFEALVRWNHNNLGLLSPDKFIPFIEKFDWLACQFSRYVLKKAVKQAKEWNCDENLYIAVNIPTAHIGKTGFAKFVDDILFENGLSHSALVLEITESSYGDFAPIIRSLANLKDLGSRPHLDDFLTGFSSFERLLRLEKYLSAVKISELFAANLVDNSDIVHLLVGVAHSRNLKVISEGIESPAQLDVVKRLGVDAAQGWLWCPALPAIKAKQWAEAYNIKYQTV